MQVAQPEVVSLIDDDGVHVGNVDTTLNDGGGNQHIVIEIDEIKNNFLQCLGVHLSVSDTDAGIGDVAMNHIGQFAQIAYAVVDNEDLSATAHLEIDGIDKHLFVIGVHLCLNGIAIGRRRLNDTEVACPHQRELEGTRDGSGGEREGVDIHLQLAEFLFDGDTELLLFVNDEETQIIELHIFSHEAMGAHEDVHLAFFQFLQDALDIGRFAGTAQIIDPTGKIFQTLFERLEMLISQHGSGHQHSHLLVVGHGLECRTHGHFGLSEAHVATHQAVHRALTLHIGLHILRGLQLVRRIFIKETGLQLVLHKAVGAIGKTFLLATTGVEFDEVAGYILDFTLCFFLDTLPRTGAQLVQAGRLALLAFILGHLVQCMDGDEHDIVILIEQLDDLLCAVAIGDTHKASEAPYAMIDVDNKIPRFELAELFQRERHLTATCTLATQIVLVETVKYLMVGEEATLQGVIGKSLVQGVVNGSERYLFALPLLGGPLFEDGLQAHTLLGTIGQNVETVATRQIVGKGATDEVEVLMENRLGGDIVSQS